MNSFTPEALAVAEKAKAFAKDMHYSDVGREHLLFAFADGAGGNVIKVAFEQCGLTPDAVRSAIVYVDGTKRPGASRKPNYIHHDPTLMPPHTVGVETLIMNQIFVGLTPNADMVFKMARRDVTDNQEVTAENVLRIFLREVDRSDDAGDPHGRRVMQVIHHIAPDLTLQDIKSAMVGAFNAAISQQESVLTSMKRARHAFMYTGAMQEA